MYHIATLKNVLHVPNAVPQSVWLFADLEKKILQLSISG